MFSVSGFEVISRMLAPFPAVLCDAVVCQNSNGLDCLEDAGSKPNFVVGPGEENTCWLFQTVPCVQNRVGVVFFSELEVRLEVVCHIHAVIFAKCSLC